jgi:hypothetical protein
VFVLIEHSTFKKTHVIAMQLITPWAMLGANQPISKAWWIFESGKAFCSWQPHSSDVDFIQDFTDISGT